MIMYDLIIMYVCCCPDCCTCTYILQHVYGTTGCHSHDTYKAWSTKKNAAHTKTEKKPLTSLKNYFRLQHLN